jgi:hypothetical protein
MSAIRLARGYTGRDTIVKFEGCYHGHSDSLLVKAGIRRAHAGSAQFARRARRTGRPHDDAHLQRYRRPAPRFHGTRPAYRLRHRGTRGRQYELHPARPRFPRNAARRVHTTAARF